MSHNQSRGDAQPRRPARSGVAPQQRGFPGGGGAGRGGAGGGGFAPPVPAAAPSNAANAANRSFRKPGDGQGIQPRVLPVVVAQAGVTAASLSAHAVANGPQSQPPSQAPLDASIASANQKQVDVSAPRPSRAVPRPPPSQSSSGPPDGGAPATMAKGEGAKPFTLQFGSIAPGFVNGMQIPARTSSAPPNLDEQKKDQASRGIYGAPASTLSVSSVVSLSPAVKQQPQTAARKDVIDPIPSNLGNPYPPPESKKEIPMQMPTPASMPSQKSSGLAVPGMSVPMFPQQTQMPLQFGGPNIPMQPPHVAAGSLQMPIAPMQMGNSPQMFVPGLQPHVLHQGQVGFAPPMNHRVASPLTNVGMGISAQYPQQQAGQFGVSRKTSVKITHPVTHEELRLDKKPESYMDPSGQRSSLPAQAQPPAFPTPQINFFQNPQPAYAAGLFYPPLPLSNAQPTVSQNPRYNFPVVQSGTPVSIVNPSTLASVSVGKPAFTIHKDSEQSHVGHSQGVKALPVTISAPVQIKPALTVAVDKVGPPSSESASPVDKDVGTKTRKTLLESTQRKGSEVEAVPQNSSEDPPIAVPAPVDHHRLAATSTVYLQQKTDSSAAVSVPASDLVFDPTSFPAHTNNEKKELHTKDSSQDHKKKPSTMEESRSQGEQAVDGLASNSSSVLSSELHKDISISSDEHILENSVCTDLHLKPKEVLASSPCTSPVAEHGVPETVNKSEHDNLIPNTLDIAEEKGVLGDMHGKGLTSSPITNGRVCSSEHSPDNLVLVPCHEGSVELGAKEQQDAVEAARNSKSGVLNDLSGYSPVEEDSISSRGKSSLYESVMEEVNDREISKQIVTPENSNNIDSEEARCMSDVNGASTEVVKANIGTVGSVNAEVDSFSSVLVLEDKLPVLEHSMLETGGLQGLDVGAVKSSKPLQLSALGSDASDICQKIEEKSIETVGVASRSSSLVKDGLSIDLNRTKAAPGRKKKKRDILSRADAAGTNSDLYMAYKGPEEHQTVAVSTEGMDGAFVVDEHKSQADENTSKEDSQSKTDIDDWEDAVEISSPRLETSGKSGRRIMAKKLGQELNDATSTKRKYTRDFLLTFSDQFMELPFGFDYGADMGALLSVPVGTSHFANNELLPGRARIIDRPNPINRTDRRVGYMEDDKWSKSTNAFPSRDAGSGAGFRAGQGGGVLRIPSRGQGGILPGQMQSGGAQGVPRNNVDADRWQRTSGLQKGLIPSPQTPAQVMHKAEKRYEVGQVSDEEEAKQRQIKAILNKLTPQNFDRLFQQVKEVNIDNTNTLTGVISQIFDKALMEPTFCEMYANFCLHLAGALPDFNEDNEKITFKRVLLNKCQEEFERGEREQAEADKADEEGEVKLSEEAKEQKRILARRRMLGNIRLIGELYKKKMLTERIMHECIKKLLGQNQNPNPDEEDIEALCKLMSTIGEIIDHVKAKEHMDAYFLMMKNLSNNQKLSSRVRFMLKDSIDLRRNNWQQRRKVDGPKKIDEVHRDAAQERAQAGRSSRGSGMGPSSRRGQPPPDYGPRGSMTVTAPGAQQVASIRSIPSQARGYGSQDVRMEDKHIYESRTLSVPLSQRPVGDDSITLGPQGGLAKGMSLRGQPLMPNPLTSDHPGSTGDTRRIVLGPNGHTSISDRNAYVGVRDHGKLDRMSDRPSSRNSAEQNLAISAGTSGTSPHSASFSEEQLRDKSISAIREYYSAKDEKEIGLCVKELNSPAFYPTMVSLWVTDSFERKDIERELLSNLLVSLCKSGGRLLSQAQLIQGFDLVLATLEDAVNDAPRATEFLGRMLARAILEDVLPFREISRLIHEGGEERGCLLEAGLAADVLASVLEIIKTEKGDGAVEELRTSSSLPLESFRPPLPMRSRKLEQFL